MLQFITNSTSVEGTIEQARLALMGGCRWIQVRMKEADDKMIILAASTILQMCNKVGAKLIIDDKVELVTKIGAHGVHLGQNDMSPSLARKLLGSEKIIGFTVNNMDHAKQALNEPISYIGIGPWRFTTTKQKLAPVLGAEGIRNINSYLRLHHLNVPIVAIGGITLADVPQALASGATGVAVSGEIAKAKDPILQTKLFNESLNLNL
jgi:thiamine-phosphate pyrophosphorylase